MEGQPLVPWQWPALKLVASEEASLHRSWETLQMGQISLLAVKRKGKRGGSFGSVNLWGKGKREVSLPLSSCSQDVFMYDSSSERLLECTFGIWKCKMFSSYNFCLSFTGQHTCRLLKPLFAMWEHKRQSLMSSVNLLSESFWRSIKLWSSKHKIRKLSCLGWFFGCFF